jgi:uncharacterized membrane protein YhdT
MADRPGGSLTNELVTNAPLLLSLTACCIALVLASNAALKSRHPIWIFLACLALVLPPIGLFFSMVFAMVL